MFAKSGRIVSCAGVLVFLVNLASSARGDCQEIWVDQATGVNNSSTPGTAAQPFKSITYALAVAHAQAWPEPWCVHIRPGSYDADPAKLPSEREAFPIVLGPGMTFEGTDRDTCIIDGQHLPAGSAALLYGNDLMNLQIRGLTLRNMNRSTGNGGGIELHQCSGLLEGCTIASCRAYQGGGMYLGARAAIGEGFEFRSCAFNSNNSSSWGGGLSVDGSLYRGNITDCTFTNNQMGNTTGGAGGGLSVYPNMVGSIVGSQFTGNTSKGECGAGFDVHGNLTGNVERCTFSGNTITGTYLAWRYGGGFCVYGSMTGNITGCDFTSNSVISNASWRDDGGGFCVKNTLTGDVSDCTFSANYSEYVGGGFQVTTLVGRVEDCSFSGNWTQKAEGGGFYAGSLSNGVVGCVFDGNWATTNGGGFFISGSFGGGVSDCEFSSNWSGDTGAGYSGAGFWVNGAMTGDIANSVFQNNHGEYAAIYLAGSLGGNIRRCQFRNDERMVGNRAVVVCGAFNGAVDACRFFGFPYCDVELGKDTTTLATVRDCLFVDPRQPLASGTWAVSTCQKTLVCNNTFIGPGLDTTPSPATVHCNAGTGAENTAIYNNVLIQAKWGIRVGPTVDLPISYNHFDETDCIVVQDQSCLGNDIVFLELLLDNFRHNAYEDPGFVAWPAGTWTNSPTYDSTTKQTTFYDSGAAWPPDGLAGVVLEPDAAQAFRALIVANTATSVTVWGDCDEYGTPGNVYHITDYHLAASSPCVDAGDPAFVAAPEEWDVDGAFRVRDGDGDGLARVDRGAHEFGSYCPGDMNCDGELNNQDIDGFICALFELAGQYDTYLHSFPTYHPCTMLNADFTGDGAVNNQDITGFILALLG